MWRRKKFVIIAVLVAVILVGGIGGAVLAADNSTDFQPNARFEGLLDRVCEIYNENPNRQGDIDSDILKDAFAQAHTELCPEGMPLRGEIDPEAMRNRLQDRLQDLLEDGKITQEQFDAMKDRIESMPDTPPVFGFRGHGGFPNMGGFRGFDGTCPITE